VKHATFVEKVWFDEAVTCRPGAEIGIPATPDESFILHGDDTIATVQQAHREACESSRRATSSLGLDEMVHGNRRGPLPLRWVYLHMLRELAQHCGHADILREQLINQLARQVSASAADGLGLPCGRGRRHVDVQVAASASISTRHSGCTRRLTWTRELAGGRSAQMYSFRTWRKTSRSAMSVR
jgi:Protein of unknown function (DUF664)